MAIFFALSDLIVIFISQPHTLKRNQKQLKSKINGILSDFI